MQSIQYFILKTCIYSLIFIPILVYGQPTDAMLIGDVQSDGQHIPGATIQIKGTTIGTVTDHTGHYMMNNLPEGKHTIIARAVGLKTQEFDVELKRNETIEKKFFLEPDPVNLDKVVITASRTVQTRTQSPVIVNSIEPQLFQSTQSITLSEGLNFIPGLRSEMNCENCGFNQLRINGLEGNYTQVLINGRPVFSGLASVYGLEIIPSNMIERVETVRGGGSVLYSGNAVAGVVNLITKDPTKNSFQVDVSHRLQGVGLAKTTGDLNASFNSTLVSDDLKSGLALYGYYRDRNPFDANDDDFSEITAIENNTIGFKAFYRPTSYNKLTVDFLRLNEFRRGGNMFDYLPHQADIAEQVTHRINNVSLTMDQYFRNRPDDLLSIYVSGQTVERDSYYGAEQDPNAYGFSKDLSTITGAKYSTGFQFIRDNVITVGIENISNDLSDVKLGSDGQPNITITDQRINTLGSFVQNEFKLNKTKLLLGLRADRYFITNDNASENNNDDWIIIPRINLLQDLTPRLQARLSYSQGYRAPQVFDEDLHIESSGARRISHQNAIGLERELSHSYTGSISYNSSIGMAYFEVLIEGFYTDLTNAFINEFGEPDEDGNVVYTRQNAASGAIVRGVNLELNAMLGTQVTWQSGYTLQSATFGEVEPEFGRKEFYRTPNTYGFTVINWNATPQFTLSANGKYTGSMLVPHFTETSASLNESPLFFDMGLRAEYAFKLTDQTRLSVYSGMNNLFNAYQDDFDTGLNRDPAYVYGPAIPRTFFVGLRFGG
jgi:outer membrane receptor for ferrienterochelin and colicins